jgi:AcrR family transcriptional regulator
MVRARQARGVGRPRADRRRRTRPPEEEILFVAARLFAAQGFAATTTREIAAAAGLRQPSLFHWFASKDAILERLLERSLAPSLAHAERVAVAPGPAAARLHAVLRFDVEHLCSYPFDPKAILLSPEARGPRFRRFWSERDRLLAIVRALIEEGVRDGSLGPVDPAIAVPALVGMNEASLSWYRRGGRLTPEAVAGDLAGLALRALLRDPAQLPAICRAASEIEAIARGAGPGE